MRLNFILMVDTYSSNSSALTVPSHIGPEWWHQHIPAKGHKQDNKVYCMYLYVCNQRRPQYDLASKLKVLDDKCKCSLALVEIDTLECGVLHVLNV